MRILAIALAALIGTATAATAKDNATYSTDNGFYVGATGAYLWGSYDVAEGGSGTSTGKAGGIVAGYTQKSGAIFGGIEMDLLFADLSYNGSTQRAGSRIVLVNDTSTNTDLLASLRAKVGLEIGTFFARYATAGLAVQRAKHIARAGLVAHGAKGPPIYMPDRRDESTQTQIGYSIGAGTLVKMTPNLHFDLGYQYYRFDATWSLTERKILSSSAPRDGSAETSIHSIRAGLNYKF